jgi:general secretion pathway protein D
MTLDNAPATLQVGDQVPVVTQAARSIDNPDAPLVNTIQFRDTGIILTVTPRISKSGDIVLEVSQEVSDVVPTTTSGIDSPTIRQRKISTTVSIRDGETMALGGLIRDSQTRGRGGVPILKDVPLMGELFSTANDRGEKTELLIFLTPRIIRNLETARDATRDLQEQMGTLRRMLAPPE